MTRLQDDPGRESFTDPVDRQQRVVGRGDVGARLEPEGSPHQAARDGNERFGRAALNPERNQPWHARLGYARRVRRDAAERGQPRFEGLAQRLNDSPQALGCGGTGPVPQDGAEGGLEGVQRARDSEAGPSRDERTEPTALEMGIHDGGLGIQVEQVSEPRQQRHEGRQERRRNPHGEVGASGIRRIGGEYDAALVVDPHDAAIAPALDQLDSRQRVACQHCDHHVPGERRPVGEGQPDQLAGRDRR
jgi:hypothetical protein